MWRNSLWGHFREPKHHPTNKILSFVCILSQMVYDYLWPWTHTYTDIFKILWLFCSIFQIKLWLVFSCKIHLYLYLWMEKSFIDVFSSYARPLDFHSGLDVREPFLSRFGSSLSFFFKWILLVWMMKAELKFFH